MIYTVTLNPSIDYVIKLDNLKNGEVNRTKEEYVYPGGKGINVSLILKELGYESRALGFVSGFTGNYIKDVLKDKGLNEDFINIKNGFTRINVKVKSSEETEINGQGPNISEKDLNKLYEKLDTLMENDVLVLAGSIPNTLDSSFYENIMKRLENKNIKIVVDATKNLLINVLKHKPFLIKPNNHELEELFNVKLETVDEIITYARKLKDMGAKNVLISRGKDGALLITENGEIFISNVAKGKVKNSVGAGDSMVAGFIAGYLNSKDYKEALKLGAASGGATAFSNDLADKEHIYSLIDEINVERR
ncbi:1-phosphofructokinase [Romboutsia hominis]|uniref:1-phosphofructokinase n=1 Tax=Romboutsia hominis TaxID=1507512 RepID=UPI001F06DD57|nr:1-phosphofructokinase [Romboutsia hominis]MCH1959953.1 1-phosphofructokinase [Romboutsia hominis]MCH1969621.1 1-phosphofructokinase [Romboutsia hominis]